MVYGAPCELHFSLVHRLKTTGLELRAESIVSQPAPLPRPELSWDEKVAEKKSIQEWGVEGKKVLRRVLKVGGLRNSYPGPLFPFLHTRKVSHDESDERIIIVLANTSQLLI